MVLDWGGGTFDISCSGTVLTISYSHDQCPNILVQSIEGLCDVRGRDVDDELLQSILDRIDNLMTASTNLPISDSEH